MITTIKNRIATYMSQDLSLGHCLFVLFFSPILFFPAMLLLLCANFALSNTIMISIYIMWMPCFFYLNNKWICYQNK